VFKYNNFPMINKCSRWIW